MNGPAVGAPTLLMARSPLLLIDDSMGNLNLLERMLEWAGYLNVHKCQSAKQGLALLGEIRPFLIILDLNMPGMDGYEFLRQMREISPTNSFLPVLVFTGDISKEAKTRALDLGASDFLTKPGDAMEIQLRVRNFLQMRKMHTDLQNQNETLEALVKLRTEHLTVSRKEAVETLAATCEFRDDETGQHCRRVGELSGLIAERMGLDTELVESIKLVAPLHDLGKVAIPDKILHKPGSLTEEELALMKRHPAIGARLLEGKTSPLLQLARDIAGCHHERWDGEGYPNGLSGESIPLGARIVAVADTFDAITNDRPYREAKSEAEAMAEVKAMAGSQFDPNVVHALEQHLTGPSNAPCEEPLEEEITVSQAGTRLKPRIAA